MPVFVRLLLALFLHAAPASGLFSAFNESSSWDDFVNNVATDLAPIIALFGEQPTKQFLSESTTYLDSIIFAMAPIGVITTVVSVIRLYGTPSLRSLIGRAQEPRALAESELCSSTSGDVCELWSNGGICRFYGRPKLLEFIYNEKAALEEFYPEFEKGDGPNGVRTTPATCGIHLPREFFKDAKTNRKKYFDSESSPNGNKLATDWTKTDPDQMLFGSWLRHKKTNRRRANSFCAPSKSGSKYWHSERRPEVDLDLWANFHAPFYKNETKPSVEFVVLTLVGTTFFVIGIVISVRLVDGKSGEQSFVSDGQSLRFCWLQAGGQRIGDQVFDEFAYSENMKEYLTSRRTDEDKRNIIHAPYSAFFAMVLSLFGWIAQFIGLRGQHGTVAFFQLLATLSMCIARGLLRHELDWQALNLPVSPNHSERNRPEILWLLFDFHPLVLRGRFGRTGKNNITYGLEYLVIEMRDDSDYSVLGSRITDITKSFEAKETLKNTSSQEPEEEDRVFEGLSVGAKLMHIRARLAYLTNENKLTHAQNWHTSVRDVAAHLGDALEKAATYMFIPPQSTTEWPWGSNGSMTAIIWGVNCLVYEEIPINKPQRNPIFFSLSKHKDRWEIDRNQLEAVLGLWSWTVERLTQRSDSETNESLESYLRAKRLIVESSKYDDSASILRSWVTNNWTYTKDFRHPKARKNWTISSYAEGSQRLVTLQSLLLSILVAISMFYGLILETSDLLSIWFDADSPRLCMMAQDIFTFFLQEASLSLSQHNAQNPNANFATYLSHGFFRNPHVEKLVDILHSTKLATREEALISIVPALFKRGVLPSHQSLCFNLLSRARSLRMQDEFRESESILRQLNSLNVVGMETTIGRAMGQLVLTECSSIMANLWKMRKSEAINRVSALIRDFQNEISDKKDNEDNEYNEEMERTTQNYMAAICWLTSNSGTSDQPLIPRVDFEHLGLFFNEFNGPGISNKSPTNLFPYDKKLNYDYGHVLALTFQYRFDISASTIEDRKQILRWAIEFGYPELVECLWILEKRFELQGSAFSGGPDEVFWTINASYDGSIKIDILHFLITVTAPNLTYSGSSYFCIGDEGDSGAINVDLNEQQALDAFCAAHPGWKGSYNIESSKRMLEAYRDYGNILTAAVSTPNSWHMVKLITEHGRTEDDETFIGPSVCAQFDTVEYITKIYPSGPNFDMDIFAALDNAGEWGRADCFDLFHESPSQDDLRWMHERIAEAAKKAEGDDPLIEEVTEFYERWKRNNTSEDRFLRSRSQDNHLHIFNDWVYMMSG
ncbi:hypothetical protein LI328DRAFT_168390 [Trichoderma asperelloides]|nr:hypothetical protein LI328DRAFT_168390 [Trichoderma asperelloides]